MKANHTHVCICTYTYTSFKGKSLVIHQNFSDFYLIHCVPRAESSVFCCSSKPEDRRTEDGNSFSCSSDSCHWAQMTPLSSPLPGPWWQTASILRAPAGLSSSHYPRDLQGDQASGSSLAGVQPQVLADWLYHSEFAPFMYSTAPAFLSPPPFRGVSASVSLFLGWAFPDFLENEYFHSHQSLFSSEVGLHFPMHLRWFSITHLGKLRKLALLCLFQKVHSAQKRWPVQVCIQWQQAQGLYHGRTHVHPRGSEGFFGFCHWPDILTAFSTDFPVHRILFA